ncbi:hypothetical protein MRX96_040397 [Rhipicephalus microplus]
MDSRYTAKAINDLRRELRKELREIKDSLKEVKDLEEGLSQILKENEELKVENAKLRSKVEEVEQYQRSNNLEIKGLPANIEPFEPVKKIGVIIHQEISEDNCDTCHRVPTSRHDVSNIIVHSSVFARRYSLVETKVPRCSE